MVSEIRYNFEDYRDIILRAFEYMYCEVNIYSDYQVKVTNIDEYAIKNFVAYFKAENPTSDNIDYILNFIESSFNFFVREHEREPKKYKHGLRSLSVSWIIGKSAIKRHNNFQAKFGSMPRFLRFVRTKVKSDLYEKIDEHTIYDKQKIDWDLYIEVSEVEEKYKNIHYNQDTSLEHCLSGTYLYNHKSKLCVFCIHNQSCKELLLKSYPKIFTKRGYE